MKKELLIFDFDGTIMNTIKELRHTMNQALKIHNFPELSLDDYRNSVNGNVDEVISNLLKDENSAENIQKVKETYLKLHVTPHEDLSEPFDGVYEMFKKLQENGLKLAINSNRYTESIKKYTDKFFPDITFIQIEGHNPPNPSKPDPHGINTILEKTAYKKSQAIYIGDSSTDIQTAKNAGIDCIIVNWGYSTKEKIDDEYVKKIIGDTEEICQYILN